MSNEYKYLLTVTERGLKSFQIELSGSYVVGRLEKKCRQVAELLRTEPTLIIFKRKPFTSAISGMHFVLLLEYDINTDEVCYLLVDGWGNYYSTNGVFCNGNIVKYHLLKHGDLISVGENEVEFLYEQIPATDFPEISQETLSQIR